MEVKKCTKCGVEKPATAEYFSRGNDKKDGLTYWCKHCVNEYNQARRKARTKTPTKNNKMSHAEYMRAWRASGGGRYSSSHEHYEANKESEKKRSRAYYAATKERQRERSRAYQQANPEIMCAIRSRRRARKRNAEGSHTAEDIQRQYEAQKGLCYYCKCKVGDTYHVDHVIPLSRGGSNWPENIVIACPTCNLSKKDKLPHEWVEGGRLL